MGTIQQLYKITALAFLMNIQSAYAQDADSDKSQDVVSAVFPYPVDAVRQLVLQEFNSEDRSYYQDYNGAIYVLPHNATTIKDLTEEEYKTFIAFPLVHPGKFYVFYGAYRTMQYRLQQITPESTVYDDNPALQRYAGLPLAQRKDDIYLWSPDAPYWYSHVAGHDAPLPFHSYFILHLYPQDAKHTVIEVIEDEPTAKFGKKLSVDSYGIVHHYDIRPVPPTTQDRTFLLSCISLYIKYDIPSRKAFTCGKIQPVE